MAQIQAAIALGSVPWSWPFLMKDIELAEWTKVMGPVPLGQVWQLHGLTHESGWTTPGKGLLQLAFTVPAPTDPVLGEQPPFEFACGGAGSHKGLETPDTAPKIYSHELSRDGFRTFVWGEEAGRFSMSVIPGGKVWARVATGQKDHRVVIAGARSGMRVLDGA